jgi:hypothetical protein
MKTFLAFTAIFISIAHIFIAHIFKTIVFYITDAMNNIFCLIEKRLIYVLPFFMDSILNKEQRLYGV